MFGKGWEDRHDTKPAFRFWRSDDTIDGLLKHLNTVLSEVHPPESKGFTDPQASSGHQSEECPCERVGSLGADRIVDYLNEDFADGTERYDVILDVGGNSSLKRLRRALAPKGTLVIVGGEEGGRWFGGIDRQLRALLLSPFIGQRLTTFVSKENSPADLDYLAELIEGGELTPVIDSSYPLQRAPEGIRRLEGGRAGGKISISTQP